MYLRLLKGSKYLPFFFLLLFVASSSFIFRFCEKQTLGFSIDKVKVKKNAFPFKITYFKEKKMVDEALSQPYHFLGAGGQCFAFESEDGRYVLKLINNELYRFPFFAHFFSHQAQISKKQRIQKRTTRDLTSYFIASTHLAEESALLALKVSSKRAFSKEITLYDPQNIKHVIDLANTDFILQEKAELLYERINHLMQAHNLQEAKKSIDALIALYFQRCEKGVYDEDAKIHRNFGFIQDRPIFIDIGRFTYLEGGISKERQIQDLKIATHRFSHWLEKRYPELAEYLNTQIASAHEKREKSSFLP